MSGGSLSPCHHDAPITLETLISDADKALYRAKHRGRDRADLFDPIAAASAPA